MLTINQNFDAGNIQILNADAADNIQLSIRQDQDSEFFQWFYYRISNVRDAELTMKITNAKDAAYTGGWEGYQAMASYDQEDWFRVDTTYEEGQLIIHHTPQTDSVYYAYFTPYTLARHQQLIAQAQCDPRCQLEVLGQTLDGRDLDLLRLGEDEDAAKGGKKRVWLIARQHPGESMAQWFTEGFLQRLLDVDDALAETLLANCVFYIVPNMNPDGSTRGHLRTNAAGVNLNRVWGEADLDSSPEVYYVQQKMQAIGCDLFFDIHGDEALPWNFIAGQAGLPVDDAILEQEEIFGQRYAEINPDFQTEHGYPPKKFGEVSLTLASNWVGNHFGIASMTLEMPFKDNAARPDPRSGWSAECSMQLGASLLYPIAKHFA